MRVQPLGDRALLIDCGSVPDDATRVRVHAVARAFAAQMPDGVVAVVPGLASVALHYDPVRVRCLAGEMPHAALARTVTEGLAGLADANAGASRVVEIGVCYEQPVAPDLDEVARHAGLTLEEVASLHVGGEYIVAMVGFLPGFPYLAGLDPRLTTPRRSTPRVRVPAGSVGIGGSHTGIYPLESPGGWQLIGRTAIRLFAADRDPPALLRMGDRVRFRRISLDELGAVDGP